MRYELPYLNQLPFEGAVVVDAGCGAGEICKYVADKHARKLYAVDLNQDDLTHLQADMKDSTTELVCLQTDMASMTEIEEDSVDIVLAIHSAFGISPATPGPTEYIREFRRVLKDGGILFVASADGNNTPQQELAREYYRLSEALFCLNAEDVFRNYTADWVRARLLEHGFVIEQLDRINAPYDSHWLRMNIDGQLEELEGIAMDKEMKAAFRQSLFTLRERIEPGATFNIGTDFVLIARKACPAP